MFSGMYIGATGMKTHSQGMSVLGNNIANVNTVAFKGSDIIFANLMSESAASAQNGVTGFSQIGMGVRVEDIKHDFSQGAFENTNTGTDLGITGKGFFRVHDDDEAYYTRAGNFNFNKEGYLVDPHGYRVQGTEITKTGRGSSKAIRLEPNSEGKVAMAGSTTTSITQNYNLGSGDKTTNAENPFFALSQAWNGQNTSEPLTSSQYDLANTIKVYDSNGTEHSLTVYLDEVAVSNGGDKRYWEYVVAMNPAEDGRAGFAGTEGAGLLMTGTMTFDSYGALEAMSAFTSQGGSARGSAVQRNIFQWRDHDIQPEHGLEKRQWRLDRRRVFGGGSRDESCLAAGVCGRAQRPLHDQLLRHVSRHEFYAEWLCQRRDERICLQ